MSIANKVNFKKGWPSSTIVERVATPPASGLEAGMVGHISISTGAWVLGITASVVGLNEEPFIFHNDQTDGDVGVASSDQFLSNPVVWGGVHGISLRNPLEIETIQFTGTPAVGDSLYANGSGILAVAALAATPNTAVSGTPVVIGVCTQASHSYQGLNYITFVPTPARLIS